MTDQFSIGIVGAGIAGLTAAVALQQRGFQVRIFEQAPELGEIGAGITVGPNMSRVLAGLGLEDEMEAVASATPHVGTLDHKTGEVLGYTKRGAEEYLRLYGAVTRHVHRADLVEVLARALEETNAELHLDHALTDATQNETSVKLSFANGASAECDVVVACDGLKSQLRDALFKTSPPQFTGFVAWRGLVDASRIPDVSMDPHFASYSGKDHLFGRYPVRHNSLINWVAVARKPDYELESWTAKSDVSEVLAEFSDWHTDVRSIIEASSPEGCLMWALHTRQPIDNWIAGRVTLLGDAAHPMTPFLGMGAAMAVEAAAIFARCCEASRNDPRAALERYGRARIDRANGLYRQSLAQGQALFANDPEQRKKPPGYGLDDIYMYDAMTIPV
jgi:salicylate hydroxylase